MGIFKKIFGKDKNSTDSMQKAENTESRLIDDIPVSAEWVVNALNVSGYKADYSLESMKEIDRFIAEQSGEGGIISRNRGQILFALGCYVGQTVIKLAGGSWITDDSDPHGEINMQVKLADGCVIWPAQRIMKRYQLGAEEGIYAYVYSLTKKQDREA